MQQVALASSPLQVRLCKTGNVFRIVWPTRSPNGTPYTDGRSDESRMRQLDASARDPEAVAHPPPLMKAHTHIC